MYTTDLPHLVYAYLAGKEAEQILRNYGLLNATDTLRTTIANNNNMPTGFNYLDTPQATQNENTVPEANIETRFDFTPQAEPDDDPWDEYGDIFYD